MTTASGGGVTCHDIVRKAVRPHASLLETRNKAQPELRLAEACRQVPFPLGTARCCHQRAHRPLDASAATALISPPHPPSVSLPSSLQAAEPTEHIDAHAAYPAAPLVRLRLAPSPTSTPAISRPISLDAPPAAALPLRAGSAIPSRTLLVTPLRMSPHARAQRIVTKGDGRQALRGLTARASW